MKKFLVMLLVSVLVLGVCVPIPSFALTNEEWAEVIGTGIGLVAGVVLPSVRGADGQPIVKDATTFQVAFYATVGGNLLGRVVGAFVPEDREIDGGIMPAGLPLNEDPTVFILFNETNLWKIEVGIDVNPREIDKQSGAPRTAEDGIQQVATSSSTTGATGGIQFTLLPGQARWASLSEGVEHKIRAHAYLWTKQGFLKVFQWESTERVNLLGKGKTIRYRRGQ